MRLHYVKQAKREIAPIPLRPHSILRTLQPMKSDAWSFVPPIHRKKIGESPFRVRGSVYAGHLEALAKHVPGGLDAIAPEIGNEAAVAFLRDTIFLVASSYDIEPLMHIMRLLARLNRIPLDHFVRDGSRQAAERDVVGKYRAQLRSGSAEEMAARLPRIFVRYFDPCRAESLSVQANTSEMRFSGLPASALGFYIWPNEGFVAGALEAAGAKDVKFAWGNPLSDGDIEGVPVQTITCRITWTNV